MAIRGAGGSRVAAVVAGTEGPSCPVVTGTAGPKLFGGSRVAGAVARGLGAITTRTVGIAVG